MATTFRYELNSGQPRTLTLRHNPTEVLWTYNVNTRSYDTYGGQVIQVLSVNIDKLTIEGQFGREGPYGYKVQQGQKITSSLSEQFVYQGNQFPGLHAMTEFFREYFAIVSQGGDRQNPGAYIQVPMTLAYGTTYTDIVDGEEIIGITQPYAGARAWKVTPTTFPSFRRSNEDFAPEWRVECEVVEADGTIAVKEKQDALARLQEAVGYEVRNPFSDPAANPAWNLDDVTDRIVNQFRSILPKITKGDLENMIWQNITVPTIPMYGQAGRPVDPAISGEYLDNEVGHSVEKAQQEHLDIQRTKIRRTYETDE